MKNRERKTSLPKSKLGFMDKYEEDFTEEDWKNMMEWYEEQERLEYTEFAFGRR